MVHVLDDSIRSGGNTTEESTKSATRSGTRRERIHGLGIEGLDIPEQSDIPSGTAKQPRKRVNARRSFVSLLSKSVESHISKHSLSRTSIVTSNQFLNPETSTLSPSLWRNSNLSTPSIINESSSEDLTTYHENLARFKAERAERAAELGVGAFDASSSRLSRLEQLQAREEDARKSSVLVGRGLRAYWGGGSSSERRSTDTGGKTKSGKKTSPSKTSPSDRIGKDALQEWWDNLGNESTNHSTT